MTPEVMKPVCKVCGKPVCSRGKYARQAMGLSLCRKHYLLFRCPDCGKALPLHLALARHCDEAPTDG